MTTLRLCPQQKFLWTPMHRLLEVRTLICNSDVKIKYIKIVKYNTIYTILKYNLKLPEKRDAWLRVKTGTNTLYFVNHSVYTLCQFKESRKTV